MAQEESFTANVKIAGINPYVDVPERVIKALGGGKKAEVLVKIAALSSKKERALAVQRKQKMENDAPRLKAIGRLAPGDWFRTTLVPLQLEPTRLYLDMWMRESVGIEVGDHAFVTLKLDLNPREIPMPNKLREALETNTRARVEGNR